MSNAGRLIEKFSLCILGEEPATVMSVLVAFVHSCCKQWNVPIDQFIGILKEDTAVFDVPKAKVIEPS